MSLLPKVALDAMVWVPGGTYAMGSDRHYAEEAPVHRVTVDGFWMDPTPVTNRQFRAFVEAEVRGGAHRVRQHDGNATGQRFISDQAPSFSTIRWQHEYIGRGIRAGHLSLVAKAKMAQFHPHPRRQFCHLCSERAAARDE